MKGELILVDNIEDEDYEFSIIPSVQDFSLSIYIDEEKTLEKQLKNRTSLDMCIAEKRYINELLDEICEDEEKEMKYIEENFENILDSVEYIYLFFEETSIKDFIKSNPIVLTKKIVINESLSITDYDKLIVLMNEYKDIIDKIHVRFAGNDNYVSLKDCYKTMNTIKKQAEEISSLGLSPMETIMYVYDQVRNRVYTFENSDEKYYKSRDLSEVLFGDKIVCVGYSIIFYTLLNYLGIESRPVHLINNSSINEDGHARNIVYVKDPKYDIDGVYYFDPTWDSKNKENDNSYLFGYKYFAKTRTYMDENENYEFIDRNSPLYSDDIFEKVKSIIESGKICNLFEYQTTITYMGNIVGEKNLLDFQYILPTSPFYGQFDKEEFLKRFKKITLKFNKEIPAETMIKLLNNVRKIEYYQDSEWYPYSINDIYRIAINSDWNFEDNHLNAQEKLIRSIFEEANLFIEPITKKTNFINYGNELDLFKNIEQIKLTKVLQKTLQKKK